MPIDVKNGSTKHMKNRLLETPICLALDAKTHVLRDHGTALDLWRPFQGKNLHLLHVDEHEDMGTYDKGDLPHPGNVVTAALCSGFVQSSEWLKDCEHDEFQRTVSSFIARYPKPQFVLGLDFDFDVFMGVDLPKTWYYIINRDKGCLVDRRHNSNDIFLVLERLEALLNSNQDVCSDFELFSQAEYFVWSVVRQKIEFLRAQILHFEILTLVHSPGHLSSQSFNQMLEMFLGTNKYLEYTNRYGGVPNLSPEKYHR